MLNTADLFLSSGRRRNACNIININSLSAKAENQFCQTCKSYICLLLQNRITKNQLRLAYKLKLYIKILSNLFIQMAKMPENDVYITCNIAEELNEVCPLLDYGMTKSLA